jgi:hypothetical protein
MNHIEILEAMAADEKLAEKVIEYLDAGLWDEWDCGLFTHAGADMGGVEFSIAAKSAASMASFDAAKTTTNKENA